MATSRAEGRIRTTAAVRAGWSILLLTWPEALLGARRGAPVPAAAVAVVRVLGARHLAQAAVTALSPTGSVAGLGAVADALHASSCVAMAAVSPRWRRAALIDALIESAFTAAGWSSRPKR